VDNEVILIMGGGRKKTREWDAH